MSSNDVVRRSYRRSAVDIDSVVRVDGIRDAEIDELQASTHHEEVCGFEIRVNDIVLIIMLGWRNQTKYG